MKAKEKTGKKYGGVRKGRPILIVIFSLLGILGICYLLYYLADNVWNGMILEWFDKHYITTDYAFDEWERYELIREPDWAAVKKLLMVMFGVNVVFWVVVVFVIAWLYSRNVSKRNVTRLSSMIHDYMTEDINAADVFPKEYAEISTEMSEIKSTIQHHEQVLKEETARKNDLIVYLAHDLKTPLTSIVGYLSLLQEAPDMPAEQRARYVGITLTKAQRLESLMNEFFDITRYNLQQISLEKETIDLSYMLVQMTDEFYPILSAHGNHIELETDEDLKVYGDPEKLARVFHNILKNAIAYSYPDTEIQVLAYGGDTDIDIYFRNKGRTIPKHKLNSIFEKFFRLDEARSTNTGGAGLGLAIAKEIVTLHGGTIVATSEEELTTFHITLPVHEK